ncbi:phospholipase A [Halomonas sp. Bachu 37]|uniref:phospholipase A n=1 Tax=Halomonas kashgarensis TaxID=3084920 RepID=UPI003217DD34
MRAAKPVVLLGCGLFVLASPLASAETREEIEARVRALNTELFRLEQQLLRLDDSTTDSQAVETVIPPETMALRDISDRRQLEHESSRNPFSITTHRTNYLFPLSYNTNPNRDAFAELAPDGESSNLELQFQFSTKVNLLEDMFGNYGDLFFAYTQRSWWQAFNTDSSSPFRETNYEPEVFISFDNATNILGWVNTRNRLAFNHQSNGRSQPLSRSWNRVYLESNFQRGEWAVSISPHWRVPESDNDDDNPDIDRYMGYGDITVAKQLNGNHEASLTWRGNPSAGNMGAQIDYSWPSFNGLRAHMQYYYGYGESLVDYDHRVHRLSLGFSLNPMFSSSD